MKRLLYSLIACCVLGFSAQGQQDFKSKYGNAAIPNLKVGDLVPDFEMPKLVNSAKSSFRSGEFKDRLLILDFWATWCSSCVAGLAKMEALQKQFGNKVMMLPVTYQSEKEINAFWKVNKYTKTLMIPSVIEDRILLSYFAHKAIPHEIWIYKGKVVAITAADYVNAENIAKVLSGAALAWPVKDDFYVFNGDKQPLFNLDSNVVDAKKSVVTYAALSGYRENMGHVFFGKWHGISRDVSRKTFRNYDANIAICNLYQVQWSMAEPGKISTLVTPGYNNPNSIVWEVADKSRYRHEETAGNYEAWLVKNGVCFEAQYADTGQTQQQVRLAAIADLNRLLGLNVRWEKRKETVLVLVRTTKVDKLKSKKEINPMNELTYKHKGSLHTYRDSPLQIAFQMNQYGDNPYVFDETNYNGKVDMDLNIASWTDVAAVRKAIAPYGLDLRTEERLVDKFVFSEVDGGLLVDGAMQIAAQKKRLAQKDMKNPSTEENSAFLSLNKNKPGVVTLPSGLQYKVIRQGKGVKAALTDQVSLNYTAALVNGKIFDSSYEKGVVHQTALNGVIKGWQEALPLMAEGSKWILYVPAELAYGTHTGQGTFPPDSVIVFEIELLKVIK